MSPPRIALFVFLCVIGVLWATTALHGQYVRLDNRGVIAAVRSGATRPNPAMIAQAIVDYQRALHWAPCNTALHDDLALLLAQGTDSAMAATDIADGDDALKAVDNALARRLACTPTDGKAWLDYAVISTYREGFSKRAMAAYTISAQVAPGESWIAEKRLLFALKFRPLFDAQAMSVAQGDLVVLARGHPNHLTEIAHEAQVDSSADLQALFVTPVQ